MSNAELIATARLRGAKYSSGSDEYLLNRLSDALEAATLTSDEDQIYIRRMEAERDEALVGIAEFANALTLHKNKIEELTTERDAALAVINKAQTIYANSGGTAEDVAWRMWVALDQQWHKATK